MTTPTTTSSLRLNASFGITSLAVSLALIALSGCTPTNTSSDTTNNTSSSQSITAEDKSAVEQYIRANISTLSPEKEVLGGTFYVVDIAWRSGNRAVVQYEDGHNAFTGVATYTVRNGQVDITNFDVLEDAE